jgi:radical SAM protein with 4Fe4S-binding SPASM domain
MDEKDAFILGDMIIKMDIPEIDVLGGEPMLVPWMKNFIYHMTNCGVSVNISTNGSLPEDIDRLSSIRTDLLNIGFSLHGLSEIHNSLTRADNFSLTVNLIKRILDAGINPIVKSVLTRENMHEIHDLISYLGAIGVKRYFLLHEDIIGRGETTACFSFPEFREFYEQIKLSAGKTFDMGFVAASGFFKYGHRTQGRCDAGMSKIAVMPDGSTFPCNLLAGFKEFLLGNIFEDGLDVIMANPVSNMFREKACNTECQENHCEHFSTCSGGCPAHSYYFYGSLNAPDPRCRSGVSSI